MRAFVVTSGVCDIRQQRCGRRQHYAGEGAHRPESVEMSQQASESHRSQSPNGKAAVKKAIERHAPFIYQNWRGQAVWALDLIPSLDGLCERALRATTIFR
jgi:hypothetical protein